MYDGACRLYVQEMDVKPSVPVTTKMAVSVFLPGGCTRNSGEGTRRPPVQRTTC